MLGRIVLIALLSGLASAQSDCQYFYSPDFYDGYPLGINHCHYTVQQNSKGTTDSTSVMLKCISETVVEMTIYTQAFDCVGTHQTPLYYKNGVNATIDCSTTKLECGKKFGYNYPCSCSANNGDCDFIIEVAIVDDICVPSSKTTSNKWTITCGSLSVANAMFSTYNDTTTCGGVGESVTFPAGCQTSKRYEHNYNTSTLDWIVCPGNMASFSMTLLVALLVAALSL